VTFGYQWMAQKVHSRRVLGEESLSDHLHIEVVVDNANQWTNRPTDKGGGTRRWALTKLDEEALEDTLQ